MKQLILVGGGHAHLFVLEALARQRRDDIEVTLISPGRWQYYSGMLPGWMAGIYRIEQLRLDLRLLAQRAGAVLIEDPMIAMDADKRCVCLKDGRHLHYDLLSLDTGSETDLQWLADLSAPLLTIKPLGAFIAAWPAILAKAKSAQSAYHMAVIGAGAGGVELALAARQALAHAAPTATVTLVAGECGPLPGHGHAARKRLAASLQRCGVTLLEQRGVGVDKGLLLQDGTLLTADQFIAATGARAPVWLQVSRLALDAAGYLAVDAHHCSLSHSDVFAAGDVCARSDVMMARSGVQAVRAGPVLAHNLLAALDGQTLKTYCPRANSLYLLSSSDGRALASWGAFAAEGRWVWYLKDIIDQRFIRRFSPSVPSADTPPATIDPI